MRIIYFFAKKTNVAFFFVNFAITKKNSKEQKKILHKTFKTIFFN
jgi:hypothetical protein